jgi:hypothetical protein
MVSGASTAAAYCSCLECLFRGKQYHFGLSILPSFLFFFFLFFLRNKMRPFLILLLKKKKMERMLKGGKHPCFSVFWPHTFF